MIPFLFRHCMMMNSLVLYVVVHLPISNRVNLFPFSSVSVVFCMYLFRVKLLTLHEVLWEESEYILLIASWLELPTFELHSSSQNNAFLAKVLQALIEQTVFKCWESFSTKFDTMTPEWKRLGEMIWLLGRKPWGYFWSGQISQLFHTSSLRARLDRTAPTWGILESSTSEWR